MLQVLFELFVVRLVQDRVHRHREFLEHPFWLIFLLFRDEFLLGVAFWRRLCGFTLRLHRLLIRIHFISLLLRRIDCCFLLYHDSDFFDEGLLGFSSLVHG